VTIANSDLYGEPLNRAEAEARLVRQVDWRLPSAAELQAFKEHRRLSKIADALIAVADVAGEAWLLMERDWSGFPDPPPFAFFAYAADGKVICEADLDEPSPTWRLPPGVPVTYSPEK